MFYMFFFFDYCVSTSYNPHKLFEFEDYALFFISKIFMRNARLKLAKNYAKTMRLGHKFRFLSFNRIEKTCQGFLGTSVCLF